MTVLFSFYHYENIESMFSLWYFYHSRMGSAEEIPCEDSSVTLITAGRAIQYFDFPKFFAECKRVLVPGGIVAFYSSEHIKFVIDDQPEKAKQLNELFDKVSHNSRHLNSSLNIHNKNGPMTIKIIV